MTYFIFNPFSILGPLLLVKIVRPAELVNQNSFQFAILRLIEVRSECQQLSPSSWATRKMGYTQTNFIVTLHHEVSTTFGYPFKTFVLLNVPFKDIQRWLRTKVLIMMGIIGSLEGLLKPF